MHDSTGINLYALEVAYVTAPLLQQMVNRDSIFHIFPHSIEDRDLVIEGAINLAYALLGVGSALGRDPIAEKQWQLGSHIIVRILKRRSRIASCILNVLNNRICTDNNSTQYAGKYLYAYDISIYSVKNTLKTLNK